MKKSLLLIVTVLFGVLILKNQVYAEDIDTITVITIPVDSNILLSTNAIIDIQELENSLPEGESLYPPTSTRAAKVSISYQAHIQNYGWTGELDASATSAIGTTGQSLRMEAIKVWLKQGSSRLSGIKYQVHVQDIGWMYPDAKNGATAGTVGFSKQLEAITIQLTGAYATRYGVRYRVHVAGKGWLPLVGNGAVAGTTKENRKIEAIQVYLTYLS
ncbi:hypothetical protein ACWOFR_09100 [Carnobacterium gallinarum]|uniref:hypothetical protein n=1 Tax=Carnobacterium gallinarum TaxID=2749 RepID=UPI00068EBC97|nr:hypothetical protein [Carnobacterium gallinarum]